MKTNYKSQLNHKIFEVVRDVAERQGVKAFVIGGWVRDLILERPSKDIDIVVEASGVDFAREVSEHFNKVKVAYYKNFGTAMFRLGDTEIEFVGARKESYQRNSRKPIVEDGTIQDDQERRDFTVNALAIDLRKENYGELVDPFGGLADMENGILRTPLEPDVTYSDDPLRMMRAIRFASQLGFTIEEESLEAIKRNAHRIEIVSKERILVELNKIIESKVPSVGFRLLFDTGILKLIFPDMVNLHGVQIVDGKAHKDNFYHTLKVLDNISAVTDKLFLRWAAIMHDIAKPETQRFDPKVGWTFHGHEFLGSKMVPRIFRSLGLPLDERMKYVQKLVLLHLRPIVLAQEVVTDSAVRRLLFDAGDDVDDLMILCEADITSKNKDRVKRYLKNFGIVREKLKEVEKKDQIRNWQPPVSGEDIMNEFSVKPGPHIGQIKRAIREAILDGDIPNEREAALDLMRRKGKELGLY